MGDAPYADDYNQKLRSMADGRVIFTGYAFGDAYTQLSRHAYLYVQPSAVNGTRPALLDQLGFGNCVLVRNSTVNMEVIEDCGTSFNGKDPVNSLREQLQNLIGNPTEVARLKQKSVTRIQNFYNWEKVTDFHEALFRQLLRSKPPVSYDQFMNAPKETD